MNSNWNYPTTMWVGKNRVKDLSIACKTLNINKPLLVTDSGLAKSKIVIDVINNLKRAVDACLAGSQKLSKSKITDLAEAKKFCEEEIKKNKN